MSTNYAAAHRYARSLRNPAKRRYAYDYIAWLRSGQEGDEPERGELSYIAAQGVRLNLYSEIQPRKEAPANG